TLNPAMYYGLEWDVGSIAPGRRADLLILRDLTDPTPERVLAQGRLIAENGRLTGPLGRIPWARCRGMEKPPGAPPDSSVFAWPEAGAVPTLHMAHTVILRSGEGAGGDGQGDAAGRPAVQAVLYDWKGRWMTRALVTGFVDRLGGLASSYSPAFHLTVIGQRPEDMAAAAGRVLERGGGMCLVENGEVLWELPLERGGLFTETPWAELTARLQELERLMRERGYRHGELLYSMFFFGFDSLPDFRLTTRGVWEVRRRRVVERPERLEEPGRGKPKRRSPGRGVRRRFCWGAGLGFFGAPSRNASAAAFRGRCRKGASGSKRRSSPALVTTDTELNAMAAPARTGLK